MMTINEIKNDDNVVLAIDGRIDTVTTMEVQNALLKAFQKSPNVIVDFEKVLYVSSAGLRAMLIGQKTAQSKRGSFKLIHMSPECREIFDTVGFSKLLNIE